MNERERLREMLAQAGVRAGLCDSLAEYGAMLLDVNRRVNVTGAQSAEELLPHLLDSLTLETYVRGPLVDIGSGGGLPAIPLALATGTSVTLIESVAKKAAFLEKAMAMLQLEGRVVADRSEIAARDPALRESFSTATARAVSSAPTVLELTAPFLAIGGAALLQRGRLEAREREAVADAAPMLGCRLEAEVPLDGDRRILIIRKIEATPQRFPRRAGIPEKRPLCL